MNPSFLALVGAGMILYAISRSARGAAVPPFGGSLPGGSRETPIPPPEGAPPSSVIHFPPPAPAPQVPLPLPPPLPPAPAPRVPGDWSGVVLPPLSATIVSPGPYAVIGETPSSLAVVPKPPPTRYIPVTVNVTPRPSSAAAISNPQVWVTLSRVPGPSPALVGSLRKGYDPGGGMQALRFGLNASGYPPGTYTIDIQSSYGPLGGSPVTLASGTVSSSFLLF